MRFGDSVKVVCLKANGFQTFFFVIDDYLLVQNKNKTWMRVMDGGKIAFYLKVAVQQQDFSSVLDWIFTLKSI